MAIQKIPVHGADITDTILSLLVPNYFDSYEESDTSGTFDLYKNGAAIATVTGYGSLKLKYNNGASFFWNFTSEYTCDYIYSCSNGLAFQFHYNYDATSIGSFLTKDNNGDPCIVNLNPASTDRVTAATYNSTTQSQSLQRATNDPLSDVTALVPVVLNDDRGSYCPNAFIMVYRQRNNYAEIVDIDGVKYISNGGMVLRDE